ncbi:MAG TPA: dihydrolipoamide acetyltransferase family protein [Nitrospirota bacterium]|jgi:pyruvate dehydrogenase E2 component (dihydrolipoamide acetyltransferase)
MAYEFKFPDIGEGLTEGEIVEWKVKPGDKVADHQTILEVETDKAVAEVPSPKAGYIVSLKGGPGDIINVGEVIAVIDDTPPAQTGTMPAAEKAEKPRTAGAPAEAPMKELTPAPVQEKVEKSPSPPTPAPKQERAKPTELNVSPDVYAQKGGSVGVVGQLEEAPEEEEEKAAAAPAQQTTVSRPQVDALPKERMLAKQLGVEIGQVRGTGPKGRVTEEDIKKYAGQGMPVKGARGPEGEPGADTYGPVERVPLRGVRRKISQAMVESLTKSAQVTTMDEADAGLLWFIRGKVKDEAAAQGVHLTLLPFIIKAVIGALKRDPLMNSAMDDEKNEIMVKGYYNIGIAVETEDGLIVPNVKDADKKTIIEIAREIEDLSAKARKRTLDIRELRGGTFTITNYGSIGGTFATPVLNYPEAGILGVGRLSEKAAVEDGAIKVKKVLPLSLTFDHRVLDGAKAQHFLNSVIRHIEDPDLFLVGV